MSVPLTIKRALSSDFQQIYAGDEPTGVYINKDGRIRSLSLKDVDGETRVGENALKIDDKILSDGQISLTSNKTLTLDTISAGSTVSLKALGTDAISISNRGVF